MEKSCSFDVTRVPFSTFGSWISISIPRDEDSLFFRNHHGGSNNLFPLRVLANGKIEHPSIQAQPWVLTLSYRVVSGPKIVDVESREQKAQVDIGRNRANHNLRVSSYGVGRVEICFEGPGTVRMRGHDLAFLLGSKNLTYSDGPNMAVINCPFTRRYQIELLRGGIDLRREDLETPDWAKQVVVSPGSDGWWEVAIDEFESTWDPRERRPFYQCLESARQAFSSFYGALAEVRPQDEKAHRLAAYVDWSCAVNPCGLVKRPSLLMSKNWMSNVWSWDHCFNAMALAGGHPDLAIDQMLTMVDHQDTYGCYPDSINDINITYNFSKPPVHGLALREAVRRLNQYPSDETLNTLWSSLFQQVEWWMTHRRIKGSRLPHYLHGNDSGWDNSTMFDLGVPLVAPDLAALLIVQLDVLAGLADRVGRQAEEAALRSRADDLLEALVEELWRDDHFMARLGNDGTAVERKSLIPWMPIILGHRLPEDIRKALKSGIEGHLTDWGLATEKVDSPKYCEDGYWQGPIWAPSTYIVVAGLDSAGYAELADEIYEKFLMMCAKSGFAENFNALTGEPLRDPAYSWTASVFMLLAERMRKRAV